MNISRKKFIPIETYQKRVKSKNNHKIKSLIRKTNSQILFENKNYKKNNDIDLDDTIKTKSLKNTSSNEALYFEHKNYDIESSKITKNLSKGKDNTSSMNKESNNEEYNNYIDEIMKHKNFSEKTVKKSNLNYNPTIPINKKSNNYSNKFSSDKTGDMNSNTSNSRKYEYVSKSNLSETVSNFNDLNSEVKNQKGLIYNYNQMKNQIKNYIKPRNKINRKEYKSQSYCIYKDIIKSGINTKMNNMNNDNNETSSTNEFTKLKSKYLELKNEHDLTLSKLKREKKKNKKQKEEIEFMIKNIKSGEKKENTMEEMKEIINQLKEENATFRQELVLSQALINSLKTELKINNKGNKNRDNNIENSSPIDKNSNILYKFNAKNDNNINDLINEINKLNFALKKKNEIIDSVLIENKKLRHELKINNNKYLDKDNNKEIDLIYNDLVYLLDKYIQYRNSNKDNNLILTEKFFKELENLKMEIDKIKKSNNIGKMIDLYITSIKIILNEFDKLLLYHNNFNKEKHLNNYNNNDNINFINKNIEFSFDKEKHNLMDLCLLSTSYIKGVPKDLILEGINIIKNLGNLYKEKDRLKDNNYVDKENINDLIMRQEKQLDNIKRKLSFTQYNQNNYDNYLRNSNSMSNFKNVLGLTYMTNYYNNNK